jgi:chemotaxis protein CheD
MDVFLAPGEMWFGDAQTRIHTILGSCVAIVMWHPQRLLGGMCHFVLPQRPAHMHGELDPYYGEDAMDCMLAEIRTLHALPHEFRVKVCGGGSMFPEVMKALQARGHRQNDALDVACRNGFAARTLIQRHGLHLVSEHLGGVGHRNVVFDVWTGDVWIRHKAPRHHV